MSHSAPVEFSVGRSIQQGRQPGYLIQIVMELLATGTGSFQDPWLSVPISRLVWLYMEKKLSSQQTNYAYQEQGIYSSRLFFMD